MSTDEFQFKRAMIVGLSQDIAKLNEAWMEQIRPVYVRWDFIVAKLPDAVLKTFEETSDRMMKTLHMLADPFFENPEEYEALLKDLGFVINDDVLTAAAQKMGASFRPVALDDSTRPVAIREARLAFLARVLYRDLSVVKILDARYIKACEKLGRAVT